MRRGSGFSGGNRDDWSGCKANDMEAPEAGEPSFLPDMSWTRTLPRSKLFDCVSVAREVFAQADRKLDDVEKMGRERKRISVASFIPRLPGAEVDRGCRRYSSYMGKKFKEHGLDFREEEGTGP